VLRTVIKVLRTLNRQSRCASHMRACARARARARARGSGSGSGLCGALMAHFARRREAPSRRPFLLRFGSKVALTWHTRCVRVAVESHGVRLLDWTRPMVRTRSGEPIGCGRVRSRTGTTLREWVHLGL
jgi:hypothetical protein